MKNITKKDIPMSTRELTKKELIAVSGGYSGIIAGAAGLGSNSGSYNAGIIFSHRNWRR